MTKERSVDEYLGFAQAGVKKQQQRPAQASSVAVSDHGAYEDSWYQVLKAQADESEVGEHEDEGDV